MVFSYFSRPSFTQLPIYFKREMDAKRFFGLFGRGDKDEDNLPTLEPGTGMQHQVKSQKTLPTNVVSVKNQFQ